MGIIHSLSPDLINQIAAGEVIESTHSILKELIENSIDAGASKIEIATESAGLGRILVFDDGHGISKEDLPLAVKRYATSKIQNFHDLEHLFTFGFRGEALASIASVARLVIESGTEGNRTANRVVVEEGKIVSEEEIPFFQGTKIEIKDLFYNTPVRRKFLKTESGEEKKNRTRVQTMALGEPNISFRYVQNGKEVFFVQKEEPLERVLSVYGENLRDHLLPVHTSRNGMTLRGFISHPDFYKSSRTGQFFFVNNRSVELKFSAQILKRCYGELLPSGAFPYAFLFFDLPREFVDVNVHPQKKEVRFLSEETVTGILFQGITEVLRTSTPVEFLEMRRRLSMPIPYENREGESSFGSGFGGPGFGVGQGMFDNLQTEGESLIGPSSIEGRAGFSLEGIGAGTNLHLLGENRSKHHLFVPKKHFGVIFETFILAEAEDGLYIIDQHTAHERIRYEEVLRDLKSKAYKSQSLLTPIRLELTKEEAEEMIAEKQRFSELGITLEPFSGGTILIREVPSYIDPGKETETILDLWERFRSKDPEEKELYDEMAKCVACRSAIKKGDQVSDPIIGELLQRLSYCENPSLCPHGRPTLIKLTRKDLETMFHRI
ncbi:DNA mismatch repair endonuclease MutL [Leptospira levettii]|uniref:DNA mismatch repair protein MutL n=1 Tax=Leptospira levettii TaxID=2023178 RepID=A0AAW5V5U8_9LEPT|nr:DNA mismatch repair endonuclease MutL [Leptospira levettii]MCW7466071.1 DNA mismatch repair endonuclease MutL [Leptospira levettii]MCW7512404.1 DNA mismatch repair endonuclease MutL [Leptospira levettii]MCW7516412.1 DNA mismatch repair endonuclease MutL [Leptospira levettii]